MHISLYILNLECFQCSYHILAHSFYCWSHYLLLFIKAREQRKSTKFKVVIYVTVKCNSFLFLFQIIHKWFFSLSFSYPTTCYFRYRHYIKQIEASDNYTLQVQCFYKATLSATRIKKSHECGVSWPPQVFKFQVFIRVI